MRVLVMGGTQVRGRSAVQRLGKRGLELSVLYRRVHHNLDATVGNQQADCNDKPRWASRAAGGGVHRDVFLWSIPATAAASTFARRYCSRTTSPKRTYGRAQHGLVPHAAEELERMASFSILRRRCPNF